MSSGRNAIGLARERDKEQKAQDRKKERPRKTDPYISLTLFAIGFSPITALATSVTGFVPLCVTALLMLLSAAATSVLLGPRFPSCGKLTREGCATGLVAVWLYDLTRVPFMMVGI